MFICLFFFFKQKTAYEMRISDWSSDVCSSDLPDRCRHRDQALRTAERRNASAAALGSANPYQGRGSARRLHARSSFPHGVGRDIRADLFPSLPERAGGLRVHRGAGVAERVRFKRDRIPGKGGRSEEHTSELQSLMRISYAVFCLKKKK